MKERPILFSGAMVRAILDGRKCMTRRVVKGNALKWLNDVGFTPDFVARPENHQCPYGQQGDRLWVREAWGWYVGKPSKDEFDHGVPVFYRADYSADDARTQLLPRWRPSIHIPRWASRILLEIVAVRVERLQDISAADAAAEGCIHDPESYPGKWNNIIQFQMLWESINGPGSWAANPWVWVIEFRKINRE